MNQRILILDTMIEQTREAPGIFTRISRDLQKLNDYAVDGHSVLAYLEKHNGKKMRNADHVWKYRITHGERVLYTYGRHVAGIREEDSGCIVLLAYSKHDDQISIAQGLDLQVEHSGIALNDETDVDILPNEDEAAVIEDISLPFENQTRHHRILIAPDSQLKEINETELDVYLSDEQYDCIESFRLSPAPTLVLGGAGTGKSMIALHILADYAEGSCKGREHSIAYFTQSAELRRNSRSRFQNIVVSDDNSCVDFRDIDDFCMDILGYSAEQKKRFVNQFHFLEKFPKWFDSRVSPALKAKTNGIDWVSVWTEIRGVIKGQLDEDWHRTQPFPQDKTGRVAAYLVNNGWIKRNETDSKKLELNGTPEQLREKQKKNPPAHGSEELKQLISYFESIDTDMDSIGKDTYLNLRDEDSTVLTKEKMREIYWQIFEMYQKYLSENGLFDCNDLALRTIKHGALPDYQFIVVDEVQDYTELQIYLAHLLCGRQAILYVGDGNQNVNPTLFRADHLRRLYRRTKNELKEIYLQKNYRSPDTVIRATNKLAELRSQTIATQHQEQETAETAIRVGTRPYRLPYNDKNLRNTLSYLSKFPSTALLVPNIITRDKLIKIFEEDNGEYNTPFIYTVSEIKGMEYRYVVCYNLISEYADRWKEIFARAKKSYQTGERYYFNLLYVAMTRSQRHLGFIDEDIHPKLDEILNLEQLNVWDEDKLHYVEMQDTPAGWLLQAKQSEEQGRYKDAILFYQRAHASSQYIRRCEAKQQKDESDYRSAFRSALLSGDKALIEELSEDVYVTSDEENDPLWQLSCFLGNYESEKREKMISKLPKAINDSFAAYSDDDKDAVRKLLIYQLDEMVGEKTGNLENWILERME